VGRLGTNAGARRIMPRSSSISKYFVYFEVYRFATNSARMAAVEPSNEGSINRLPGTMKCPSVPASQPGSYAIRTRRRYWRRPLLTSFVRPPSGGPLSPSRGKFTGAGQDQSPLDQLNYQPEGFLGTKSNRAWFDATNVKGLGTLAIWTRAVGDSKG
jgi:hypothetical protein